MMTIIHIIKVQIILTNVLFICGTILNSLVMSIYTKDWCKKKSLNVCDQILLSMVFTSTNLQWVIALNSLIIYMQTYLAVPIEEFFCLCVVLVFFLIEATFWQLAVLSTYYCVKLFDFTFPFFRWVKRLILGSSTRLLLISTAVCLAMNFPFFWALHLDRPQNVTEGIFNINSYYRVFNMMFGCCLPFVITFTCIVLSVGSLMRHVWTIKSNVPQYSSSPQLGGHIRAAGTMALCLVLDLSFILSITGILSLPINRGEDVESISWAIVSSYPIILSVILIIGNPQLRRRVVEMCAS
ncbi:taste receptor type 2 member 4-like [Lithobates pipiens]